MPEFNIIQSPVDPGTTVIEASAGTGKTYALSHLVARFLLDGTVADPGEILLVTFTNDAAKELSERTRRVMELLASDPMPDEGEKHLHVAGLRAAFPDHRATMTRALERLDRLNVSTIHSFCTGVLQTEGTLCGYPTILETVSSVDDLVEEAVHECWKTRISLHPVAAAVAVGSGWNVESDLVFFRKKLPLHAAVPEPTPPDFDQILAQLEQRRNQATPDLCRQLGTILPYGKWINKFTDAEAHKMLETLEHKPADDHRFWKAVSVLAKIVDKFVPAAQRALVQQSPLVVLGKELDRDVKLARWGFRWKALGNIHESVDNTLRKNRQIAYDGLIDAVANALREDSPTRDQLRSSLRTRFKVALIDEAQDTDPKQYEIFKTLFLGTEEHRLVMVGDPKQAIYGFRGADLNTYLRAKNEPGVTLYDLTRTFRAPTPLVEGVNALFRRPYSFLNDRLTWTDAQSGLLHDIRLIDNGTEDASRVEFWLPDSMSPYARKEDRHRLISAQIATKIRNLIAQASIETTKQTGPKTEKVRPADFAVLVSSGKQASAVEEALKEAGIPAVRAAGDDVMDSDEAADLLAILRALDEPRRKALRFTALATRMMGRTDADLRGLGDDDEAEMEKFRLWGELLEKHGPAVAIARIDHDEKVSANLAKGDDGDRRITNLRQLIDLLQEAFREHGGNVSGLLRWFTAAVSAAEERSDIEERQIRLESDAEAVQIVTMHKAKGLEYRLVFCPFLWDIFEQKKGQERYSPDNVSIHLADIDLLGKDSTAALAIRRAALEERIRLAYVAVTRAQVKVWIHAGWCCGKDNKSNYPAHALDWILRTDGTRPEQDDETFKSWLENAKSVERTPAHAAGISALKEAARITDDLIQISNPPEVGADVGPVRLQGGALPLLEALPTPDVPTPWRLTSFSSLTREKNPHWSPVAGDATDNAPEGEDENQGADQNAAPIPPANPFLLAQGSKLVGTIVHDWIEGWDFGELDAEALHRHLSGYSLPNPPEPNPGESPAPSLEDSISGMLSQLREARLPGLGISIAEACPEPAASEWQFHLPIARTLGPSGLADIFAAHEQEGFEGYAESLARLSQDELEGYLHGFLDRIALQGEAGGEQIWGVVDWKTNRLGDTPGSYRLEKLRACAMQSHYYLQTQLYLVALRRHLGKRLDQDSKISGAWLVFLRGIAPGSEHGILHIPYKGDLIDALDGLFTLPTGRPA